MKGTSYHNAAEFTAAVALDSSAEGVVRCTFCSLFLIFPFSSANKLVLGDRATIKEIVQSFEKVYGVENKMESRSSLDDLYKHMHDARENDPQNIYSYMALYALYSFDLVLTFCDRFFYYYWTNGQAFVGSTFTRT